MESLTYLKNVKMTPKKLRMIRDNIVRMKPQESLDYLNYMTMKSAELFYASIHSAIANATSTLKVSPDVLKFKLLTVEEGRKLKRYRAGSRGMARPFAKRSSHIKIILIEDQSIKSKVQNSETLQKKGDKKSVSPKKLIEAPKKAEPKKKEVKKVTKRLV
ncbi:MAG: uL22 family ribosomal protein [bacterium]|nr:uL22 family ribosomal protein [bacterium]